MILVNILDWQEMSANWNRDEYVIATYIFEIRVREFIDLINMYMNLIYCAFPLQNKCDSHVLRKWIVVYVIMCDSSVGFLFLSNTEFR